MWNFTSILLAHHKQSDTSFVHLNYNETKMLDHPKFYMALYFSSDYINSVISAVAATLLFNVKKSVTVVFCTTYCWKNKSLCWLAYSIKLRVCFYEGVMFIIAERMLASVLIFHAHNM